MFEVIAETWRASDPDRRRASRRRNGVQCVGNQQVQIAIVQLKRREAVGLVAHVKSSAQRLIILRYLFPAPHFALASAESGRLSSGSHRMQAAAVQSGRRISGSSGFRPTFTGKQAALA